MNLTGTTHNFIINLLFFQGNPVEKQLAFNPPISAYDQDLGINASLQYSIINGE